MGLQGYQLLAKILEGQSLLKDFGKHTDFWDTLLAIDQL